MSEELTGSAAELLRGVERHQGRMAPAT